MSPGEVEEMVLMMRKMGVVRLKTAQLELELGPERLVEVQVVGVGRVVIR